MLLVLPRNCAVVAIAKSHHIDWWPPDGTLDYSDENGLWWSTWSTTNTCQNKFLLARVPTLYSKWKRGNIMSLGINENPGSELQNATGWDPSRSCILRLQPKKRRKAACSFGQKLTNGATKQHQMHIWHSWTCQKLYSTFLNATDTLDILKVIFHLATSNSERTSHASPRGWYQIAFL